MNIRDRIKELRRVRAEELRPHPKNWRKHPEEQQKALRAILAEVGFVDALMVRELPGGALQNIDGHLRAETTPDSVVPVLESISTTMPCCSHAGPPMQAQFKEIQFRKLK